MKMVPGWRRAVAIIVALTALATVLAVLTDMGPHVVLLVGFGVLVGVTVWMVVALNRLVEVGAPWDTRLKSVDDESGVTSLMASVKYRIPAGHVTCRESSDSTPPLSASSTTG